MPGLTRAFCLLCASLLSLSVTAQQQPDKSQQATIDGATLSADGQPLRKTNLTLRPLPNFQAAGGIGAGGAGPQQMPTPYATTSDAAGKFSFTGLDPGRYQLMAEHSGYLNTSYGLKRGSSGTQTGNPIITLTAGQHMTGVNIQLDPQATISGKVTDEDGDPMPRIRISAVRRMYMAGGSRLMNQGTNTTDDNGEFHLTNLQPGRYYVSFSPQPTGAMQQARRSGADAAGPEMGYGTVYYPGVREMDSAVALDLVEGQDKAGINVQMHKVPVFHVRGTTGGALPPVDPSAPPGMMTRMQISIAPAGDGLLGVGPLMNMRMTNPDGTFDVGGLTPGLYTVTLLKTPGQVQTLSQTTVVVSDRDLSDINLTAKDPVDVAGNVKIVPEGATVATPVPQNGQQPNGRQQQGGPSQPPALARVNRVTLQPAEIGILGGNVQPATVGDDGSFVFKSVPPVKFRVSVNGVPQGGYLKSATFNGQDALASAIDMSGGGTLSLVVSITAAEIDGNVAGADGQPATGVTVVAVPDPLQPGRTDVYRQGMSRSDGAFTLRALPPGKYRLFAFEDMEPGAFYDPDFIKPLESLGVTTSLDDNDKKSIPLVEIPKDKLQDILRRAGK